MEKFCPDIEKRFEARCARLLGEERRLTVALSGGADSTALLALAAGMRERDPRLTLAAVHVHHGLRREEADRDAAFCEELCAKLSVPLTVRKADVPAYAQKSGRSEEESARILRYKALREAAPLGLIATAHTADDELETLILRLARGSGTAGMAGIPEKNGRIIRPLLTFGKDELTAYLRARGVEWVTDSTNLSGGNLRALLRREALPALKRVFPSSERAAIRTAENCREDDAYLYSLLPAAAPDAKTLSAMPSPLLKRLLLRAYAAHFTGMSEEEKPKLEETHLNALVRMVRSGIKGKRVSLPGRTAARLEDAGVVFSEDERARAGYAVFLKEGENPLPGERILFLSRDARAVEEYTGKYGVLHTSVSQTTLDGRMIEGGMYCRPVKAGDRVYFGGMTRRVAELIRVRVKDTAARREYPLLCDKKGVLWVPGCPPREERAKAAGGSANGDKIYICLVNGGAQNEEKHQG